MRLRKIDLTVGSVPIGTAYTWSYPNSDGQVYVVPTYGLTVVGMDASGIEGRRVFEVLRFGVHRTIGNTTPRIVGLSHHYRYVIRRWIPTYKVHSFPSREDGAWQVHGNYLIHDGPDDPKTQLYATAGCIEICGGPDGFVAFNRFLVQLSGTTQPTPALQLKEIGDSACMTITYLPATLPAVTLR
jgi:hypothetical protein